MADRAELIDWDVAVATARTLVRPGPQVTPAEARAVTAQLRSLVPVAERHVQDFTGLVLPEGHIPVAIVDRAGWIRANVGGFRVALEPLTAKLAERRRTAGAVRVVTSRVTGAQVGVLLSYLAGRVLGQFELFLPAGEGQGRLTLVAPNIVEVERKLGADPDDFRLWVTLHEVTHRTQFTAVPWLREYFLDQVRAYVDATDLDPAAMLERLRAAAAVVRDAVSNEGDAGDSLLSAFHNAEQRVVVDRLQALMSLLEGHGDFVMDGVGPAVVPSAARIRAAFNRRRQAANPVDRVIRRLFGLELKLKQYAEGERFVREVVAEVGMAGFNRVWESPDTLPVRAEITAPQLWLDRVARAARDERP